MRIRKAVVALSISAVAVASAGAAFAFWTTSGAGTGSATSASANGTLALSASFANGLAPGQAEDVTYHAVNGSATDLRVGTVHAAVSTDNADCLPGWFSIGDVVSNQVIPGHSEADLTLKGSLAFNNNAANQDPCKGAKVTLTLSS